MKYINRYTGSSFLGLFLLMSGLLNAQEMQSADDGSASQTQVQSQAQIRDKTANRNQTRSQQPDQPGATGQKEQYMEQARQQQHQTKGSGLSQKGKKRGGQRKQ